MLSALLIVSSAVSARGTYQEPQAFVSESFAGKPPEHKVLWITDAMLPEITRILGHPFGQRRVRYWHAGERSVWILDEIGKEEPITAGYVVNQGRIERVRILIYRESRGEEVRYPRFTKQFTGAGFKGTHELDRTIDSISGATLSVQALTRSVRLALYLDRNSRE